MRLNKSNYSLTLLLSGFMILFQITMQLSVVFLVVLAASWVQAGAVANRCDPTIIAFIQAYNEKVPDDILFTVSNNFLKLIFVVSRRALMKLLIWNRGVIVGARLVKFPCTSLMVTMILYCTKVQLECRSLLE